MKGKVKWFSNKKGYGFITSDEGTDIFVHFSAIESEEEYKTLIQGQDVTFDIAKNERGQQAVDVKKEQE